MQIVWSQINRQSADYLAKPKVGKLPTLAKPIPIFDFLFIFLIVFPSV